MPKTAVEKIVEFNFKLTEICQSGGIDLADKICEYLQVFRNSLNTLEPSRPNEVDRIKSVTKHSLVAKLSTLGPESLDVLGMIQVLESAFRSNGVFNPVQIPWVECSRKDGSFLSAMYFMSTNYSVSTRESADDCFAKISEIGFAGDKEFFAFLRQMEKIERARPGRSSIQAVESIVREMHMNPRFSNESALKMMENGGLQRCLDIGTDPGELLFKMLDNLSTQSSSYTVLPKLHSFCTELNDFLFMSLKISRKQHLEYGQALFDLAIRLSKSKPDYAEPLVEGIQSIDLMDLSASQIINYAKITNKNDPNVSERLTSSFDEQEIKKAIQSLDASDQARVISRLKLDALYTTRELTKINGRRLEGELGM